MKRFIFITAILAFLCSCTDREISRKLEDVESYIMERPDSALKVLESIDRAELTSERSRAHNALLHAMALDKNFIDVTSDSLARIAVNYYKDHEPQQNYARALYYLGKCYYYRGEYDKAILEYSKAEKVAEKCDSLYLGMIKVGQASTYSLTYNSVEELKCIKEAVNIFQALNISEYLRPAKYYLGIAYHNTDRYEEAVFIFNELTGVLSSGTDDIHVLATIQMAHSMIECDEVDYYIVDSLFQKAKYEYEADFTEEDLWAWAYSLYRIGNNKAAEEMIENISSTEYPVANFWKSRIYAYLKDYESVYKYDLLTTKYQDAIVEKVLEESLSIYQRDYYQSELENAEYKIKVNNLELIGIVGLSVFILFVILLAIRIYTRKQKAEKNRLLEYVEEIKRQLSDAEKNDYSALKQKYISLYKARFETIGTLFDQYMQAEGRTDIESLMFKKVEAMIKEINNDAENRATFEAMLDEDLDMIMSRLRAEMPKFKEVDYSIFSYLVVGFDATTISRLLDMTVNNVYTHKHRIRVRIEEKNPEHASQFLEILL